MLGTSQSATTTAAASAAQGDGKREYVQRMFSDIAPRYDLLNHVLSLNIDRRWRRRALKRLGRTARPVTFLGGPTGILCEHLLRHDDQLDPIISPTESTTRTILTVRVDDGPEPTVFFDPDPVIQPAEADDLLRRVERELAEGRVEALALSGSSPGPSTHGVYSDLICLARARRVPIFLDTYGPALESRASSMATGYAWASSHGSRPRATSPMRSGGSGEGSCAKGAPRSSSRWTARWRARWCSTTRSARRLPGPSAH